ncbi:MAG TPA: NAD-dependent epimerase/dehydratase family protein, partial [Roseimicrobium sp.]|nr:NAD-dependent epimerase/dehydratase family protein [Roseimicrobium sp.]
TKLASEALALEYLYAFDVPVWINRCGVLAGAGQFGRADQGIFAFWINAWLRNHPLKYIGFDGGGHQVRDCLHPRDLVSVLSKQMAFTGGTETDRICNFSGCRENAMSLAQLSAWCAARFGPREIIGTPLPRPYDVPWLVLDSRRASELWNWKPQTPLKSVLDEIAVHAEANPQWLEVSDAR